MAGILQVTLRLVVKFYYSTTDITLYAKWLSEADLNAGNSFENAITLEKGVTATVDIVIEKQWVYYKFIAPEGKMYTFTWSNHEGSETAGKVHYFNDNKFNIKSDFSGSFTNYLSKGELCYLAFLMVNSNETGSFDITIS